MTGMNLGIRELILICLAILVLCGPQKTSRNCGRPVRGIKELRKAMKLVREKIEQAGSKEASKSKWIFKPRCLHVKENFNV